MIFTLKQQGKVLAARRSSCLHSASVLSLVLFFIAANSFGQDISMFTQKMSSGLLFNPSAAGVGSAHALFSYRNNYSGVKGSPNTNYLSLSIPFYQGRFGVGLNLIQDKSSLLNSTYLSSAFAYHLVVDKETSISMGVSGDLNVLRLSDELLNQNTGGDLVLNQYTGGLITPDFSAGTTLKTRLFQFSAAMNHLRTSWNETGAVNQFTRYFTTSLVVFLPLQDGQSRVEPYVNYRNFFKVDQILDMGMYYSFNNKFMIGLGSRNFKMATLAVGTTILPAVFIGYSREQISGPVGRYLGSTNEVVLRLGLPDHEVTGNRKVKSVDQNKLMYILMNKRHRPVKRMGRK